MEDDLKILNVEYLSNRWTDLTQIWNLILGDQTKVNKFFKWRWLLTEDDLKILDLEYFSNHWTDLTKIGNSSLGDHEGEYLSNHWMDLNQIWNLSLGDQIEI